MGELGNLAAGILFLTLLGGTVGTVLGVIWIVMSILAIVALLAKKS